MSIEPAPEESNVSGYYVWRGPGKSAVVHLNLDVIDRLSGEVMTGFGAIPRRGAEVGGILTGCIERGIVRIEDFVPVPCAYKRGPSYLLSEADAAAFQEAYDRVRPSSGAANYAVAYYRSNTREQTTLAEEDYKLCKRYFPGPLNVVLLIKPYASKASVAGFITYEEGQLEESSALDFPFRRYELDGGEAPVRRPLAERSAERPQRQEPAAMPARQPEAEPESESAVTFAPERVYAIAAESRSRPRGWVWIPLSFIFLLIGVLLGFQAALTIYPKGGTPIDEPYALALTVTQNDDNLHVKWNRGASAVLASRRGMLEITDGKYSKKVELDVSQLQNGSVIYRRLSKKVSFRMEVYPRDRVIVSEQADWRE